MDGPKKECQTTHHPECKKIPHTVYVEKCDVNTEQKCETVYESVQDENCNTVYDTKCHTSYDAPLYRNSKVNLHPFQLGLIQITFMSQRCIHGDICHGGLNLSTHVLVKVSENLGVTAVVTVAPVVTSL